MSPSFIHPIYELGIGTRRRNVDIGFNGFPAAVVEFECDVGRAILFEGLTGVGEWCTFPYSVAVGAGS